MEIIFLILGLAVLAALVWYFRFYKKGQKIPSPYDVAHKTPETHKTPRGASVRSQNGEKMSAPVLQLIDEAIEQHQARVERLKPNYRKKFAPGDFIVCLLDAEIDSNGLPVFKVPIPKDSPYYHTDYNKGTKDNPYVHAAGLMVAVGNPYGNIIAVPKPITQNWEYFKQAIDFECEHIQAAWNEPSLFEATKHHTGSGHPIYREAAGLVERFERFVCIAKPKIGELK